MNEESRESRASGQLPCLPCSGGGEERELVERVRFICSLVANPTLSPHFSVKLRVWGNLAKPIAWIGGKRG